MDLAEQRARAKEIQALAIDMMAFEWSCSSDSLEDAEHCLIGRDPIGALIRATRFLARTEPKEG